MAAEGDDVEAGVGVEADLVVPGAQLVERAGGDEVAVVDDHDAVGEALGLVELVGGEHDRAARGRRASG